MGRGEGRGQETKKSGVGRLNALRGMRRGRQQRGTKRLTIFFASKFLTKYFYFTFYFPDIIRDNCNSVALSSASSSTPSASIFSSFKTSAVQWAWYAVTAIGKQDHDDPDSDGLKSKIRTSLGNNGACDLLFITLSMYGVIPSSSPSVTSACADVVQWTLSAMAVLARDNSNLQLMLSTMPLPVVTLPPPPPTCDDDTSCQVGIKGEQEPSSKSNTITEKPRENFNFFSRSSNNILPLTAEEKLKIPSVRTSILMKAMNANLNNSDIAEEFCGAVHALITCDLDQEYTSSSDVTSTATSTATGTGTILLVQLNKELLISSGVNELLVKILLVHENIGLSAVDDEVVFSPVLEGALSAIAQVRLVRIEFCSILNAIYFHYLLDSIYLSILLK